MLDGSASFDPNGDPIVYSWDLDGDGTEDSSEPAPTYTWPDDGEYTVYLTVSDTLLVSEEVSATVVVRDTGPSATVSGPQTVEVDQPAVFSAAAISPCDDVVSIEWDWDYTGSFTPSGDEGETQTHVYQVQGDYTVAVLVTDEDGSTALATLSIEVVPSPTTLRSAETLLYVRYSRRAYDPRKRLHYARAYLFNVSDTPVTGPIVLVFDEFEPPTASLYMPDGQLPDGRHYIDFSSLLIDNQLPSGQYVGPKVIYWNNPSGEHLDFVSIPYILNAPPQITSQPVTVATEGEMYTYQVTAEDANGDSVEFGLPEGPAGMTVNPSTGLLAWRPPQDGTGEYEVTVTATDGYESSVAQQMYVLTVFEINVPPQIISIPETSVTKDLEYFYQVEAFDPDGDPLGYALGIAPSGMTIDADSGLVEWLPDETGSFEVRVRVSDDHGHQAVQDFFLTVVACADPPVITSLPVVTATEGELYTYAVEASVPSGELFYSLPIAPSGMSIDETGLILWTPSHQSAGLRTVKVVVATDVADCQAEQIFQIDVADVNVAPVFTSMPVTTVSEGALYNYHAEAVDPDGDPITYLLSAGPEGMTVHSQVGTVTWMPSQTAAADYPSGADVWVTACDSYEACTTQQYAIEVTAVNVVPQIISTPIYSAMENELYEYAVEAIDLDDDPLTFVLDAAPEGMSIDASSGLIRWTPGQTAAAFNPHPVHLTVSDPGGNTASQVYEIFVLAVNVPPVITSEPVITAVEGQIYRYDVEATDEDGDTLTFGLAVFPNGMNIHPGTGEIDWLVPQTAAAEGPQAVTVIVSDGTDTMEQSFEITADQVNVAPVIYSTPVTEAAVGASYVYDVDANDLDGDTLTYVLTTSPAGITIDEATGLIEWLPSAGQAGDHSVEVLVTDPSGLSDTQTYILATAECDDAPQFTSVPKTTARPGVLYEYDVEATTVSGTITFALTTFPSGMSIDPTTGSISWTPGALQVGITDVTVVATRDDVCPSEQSFEIEVRECSISVTYHQPMLVPGQLATFIPQATANCEPLSFELLAGPEDMVIDPASGIIQWVAVLGPFAVEVGVTDAWDASETVTFDGEVLPETPPRITSTPPFTAQIDEVYTYQVIAVDDEGDTLTYSFVVAPSGMSIDDATGLATWTPASAQIGSHEVGIRVDDGRGGWATQTYTLTVSLTGENHPPQITSTPLFTAAVGQEYIYQVTATDEDGDTLAYSIDTAPAGASIDSGTGLLTWTPVLGQVGSRTIKIRVDDGTGGWATQEYGVTVSLFGDNVAPVITSTPTFTAAPGATYLYDVEASDPDGDPLSYLLDVAPVGMTIDAATGLIEWVPADAQLGCHEVVAKAVDNKGGWAAQSYTITVSQFGDNTAPRVISTPLFTAAVDALYDYQVQAVDDDGDPLAFELSTAPAGMTIDTASGLIAWTPAADQIGTHAVELRVSDGRGASASQSYNVTASSDGSNHGPRIVSMPVSSVVAGTNYEYAVEAVDEDDDDLAYAITDTYPAGMIIDPATGLITWDTVVDDVGTHAVTVRVTDVHGAWGAQSFDLEVRANSPPQIVSEPVIAAIAEFPYSYDVQAIDPDELQLSYFLTEAPTGMTIDQTTGEITWTPTADQVGDHGVTVVVNDSLLAEASQDYTVSVFSGADADTFPPEVVVTIELPAVDPGQPVIITVEATDDLMVASVVLTVNDEEVDLDSDGQAVFTPTEPGPYVVRAVVTDVVGHTSESTADFYVRGEDVDGPPTVAITSPSDGSELKVPTEIIGTASDDNLYKYTLAYRSVGDGEFITFATGYESVVDDILGTLDPTMMTNGLYELLLQAEDTGGNVMNVLRTYSLSGDMKVGNFSISFTDLTIPVSGIPITITRTYDSRVKSKGDFGIGWDLGVASLEIQESKVVGEDWVQYVYGGFFPSYSLQPLGSHAVSITWPDGRVESFEPYVNPSYSVLFPIMWISSVGFTPVPPATSTLTPIGNWPDFFDGGFGVGDLIDFFGYGAYDPTGYVLTTDDGTVYTFAGGWDSRTAKLQSVKDPNGNTIQFTSSGIIHSAGKSVLFARDGQGRITQITDPMGNTIEYVYDGRGDLVSVTDQEANTTQFRYNRRHGLIEIIDPRGISPARNIYDDDGRLVAIVDADGNRIEFEHDPDARQEVVRDRLGNITIYEYDDDGNVTAKTDTLGNRTEYTYDARGNKLTQTTWRTLPSGEQETITTTYTYDANNNLLTQIDPLGNTTTYTYNSHGQVLTTTDPLGNVTTNTYDANGNLETTTDPLGNVTTHTYDPSGNMTSSTDPLGNVASYTYDSSGNMTSQTDPLGNVTTFTYDINGNQLSETTTRTLPSGETETITTTNAYDALNRLVETTDTYGNTTRIEYNAIGKQSATVDKLSRRTEYEYDARGNLVRTIYPDTTESTQTYDAEGRRLTSTDRAGRTTSYTYDALGRLTRTTFPDDTYTQTEYDAVGRVERQIDERGNATTYAYDAAGRSTLVTDALGNVTTYEYDANGNQIQMTDANGNTFQYEYDASNRRIRTVFSDGSTTTTEYNTLGQKVLETDQAGQTTSFAYDAMGRLIAVIDALGSVTTYSYDEVGNRITQTDAEGRTTQMEYDALGRMTKRTLPLGQEETFTYNANGNTISNSDFNGATTTFTYDDNNNRMIRKDLPDGSSVSYAYAPDGLRTLAGGDTYTYDSRGRLLTEIKEGGAALSYTYDEAGNRTSVTTPEGTTTYTFDALNRMKTVADPDGGVTTYTYDAVGNRASVTYPNGTVAEYTYDSLNRLTNLVNRKSDGEVISSYAYTLGPAGNRTRVVEHTGRTVDYEYDYLYRLIGESVDGPGDGQRITFYTYDAVGNRLHQATITDDVLITTFYTYDDNDRLLTEDRTEAVVRGPPRGDGVQYASAHPSHPRPSRSASQWLGVFLALSFSAFLLPLGLLTPRRHNIGRGARRRQIFINTIALFLIPCMVVGPNNVEAMHVEVQLYNALAAGTVGQMGSGSANYTYTYDDNGNTLGRSNGSDTDTYTYDFDNRLTAADIQLGSASGPVSYTY
ncbi:MAG: putative Ig domain-containing protein, partial [Phycisphaerae bacterium]